MVLTANGSGRKDEDGEVLAKDQTTDLNISRSTIDLNCSGSTADIHSLIEQAGEQARKDAAAYIKTTLEPRLDIEDVTPISAAMSTYVSYMLMIIFGHFLDFFQNLFHKEGRPPRGYAPIVADFDSFFNRRLYRRCRDSFNRPIASAPGRFVKVVNRTSDDYNTTFKMDGTSKECLNLASYNYLGFGDAMGPCHNAVAKSIKNYSVSTASSRLDAGTTDLHVRTEALVARFVGKEDAIIFGMGFATNSTTIPALATAGTLILSDTLNHTSLVQGCRASGGVVRTFKHGDAAELEKTLRNSIAYGMPRTRRPWKKIIVIIEGVYSMEGDIVRLPQIVAVCKKYKAYVYLDEAHSIGAMGPRGRGVCDHYGVDPANIDVMMGTFTKSFGSVGGYIAGSKEFIDYLRVTTHGQMYCTSISPVCCQQIISSMSVIMGEDGTDDGKNRLAALRENSNYFRDRLKERGFVVLGDRDSPVVPMVVFHPSKASAFGRETLAANLACVVVGYPATPLLLSRARFCVSAAHKRVDLDRAIAEIDRIGEHMLLKYAKYNLSYSLFMETRLVLLMLAGVVGSLVAYRTFF